MKRWCAFIIFSTLGISVFGQTCSTAQSLTSPQQVSIYSTIVKLDTALKYEDLHKIDSLSAELKNIYGDQAGLPDAVENYFFLNSNSTWLDVPKSLSLSRILIAADSAAYVDLWKMAKGMKPPLYQPNSIFLRTAAELATGLLKIASKETDSSRKALYQSWALKTLDSLATMQLPNGAFPFPDLRTQGDPVFAPIIQNFLNSCGADSVKVLKNGWIVDDKWTGEFKFDAGVIANVYYEAYQYTGNIKYKSIAISIGNYLKTLKLNVNYNYNTFVSLGLTRAFQLSNDSAFLNRAIVNLRYGLYPGQIANGRWVDGHNANSRYHSIIIQNIIPTLQLIPSTNIYKSSLETMTYRAVKNMVDYSYSCHAATGYRWLFKAYELNSLIIPSTLKDSINDLIGQHINQSAINGKFLDVQTMGEYLVLLEILSTVDEQIHLDNLEINVFPNPASDFLKFNVGFRETTQVLISLCDMDGRIVKTIDDAQKSTGKYDYTIDLSQQQSGFYFLTVATPKQKYMKKIVKVE